MFGPPYTARLIYGLISREDTDSILASREPGTFIIRFSERHPGLFAVGYKISDKEKDVGHYLVKYQKRGIFIVLIF